MKPRVLLVEDDVSIQRFVALALEDCDCELRCARTLAEAHAALRERAPALLITDLMLPDGHGSELLRALQAEPALRGGAALAVFSAGVSAARREELLALDVSRVLEKPVPVHALLACVQDALDAATGTQDAPNATSAVAPSATSADAPGAGVQDMRRDAPSDTLRPSHDDTLRAVDPADEAAAVAEHFGGKAALFQAFKATSEPQLRLDLRAGDEAAARGDAIVLRLTAHNLKTALRLLGRREASQRAHAVERGAADGAPAAQLQAAWQALREALAAAPQDG